MFKMKNWIFFLLVVFFLPVYGQENKFSDVDSAVEKQTFTFSRKDTVELKLDKYRLKSATERQACVFFVFGGGFTNGKRDSRHYNNYFNYLSNNGYTIISIDYRLGLAGGKKNVGTTNYKPLLNAIQLAVNDLFEATAFAIQHADEWNIDTNSFVISGSSAGAITAMQAEYENRNKSTLSKSLPSDFQYAGVISFSGAIFNTEGSLKWKAEPCPFLLFHGDNDKIVPYKGIRFFKLNFAGSKKIAADFNKKGFPYWFLSFKGAAHEIAEDKMDDGQEAILEFLQYFVTQKERKQVDSYVNEMDKYKSKKVKSYKDLY
jgi:dipeptidyl aminopeptidase/acylaminoacyl peptidase